MVQSNLYVVAVIGATAAILSYLWRPVILGIKDIPTGEDHKSFVFENIWNPEQTARLLQFVKDHQSYFTAVDDQTSRIDNIGEAVDPLWKNGQLTCEHPYLTPNKNRTKCVLPSRIDVGRHFLLTGGRGSRKESYDSLISRLQVFNAFFFSDKEFSVKEEVNFLFESQDYKEKAAIICKAESFSKDSNHNSDSNSEVLMDPIQLGIVISLPGQEVALHWDVPWFFGASRFIYPQWLLVAMQNSQLFNEDLIGILADHNKRNNGPDSDDIGSLRVPQVQGVAYLHDWVDADKDGGEFIYYPAGVHSPAMVKKAKFNSGIILDGSVVVHSVDVFKAAESKLKPLPYLPKDVRHELRYKGGAEDAWELINTQSRTVLQTYHTSDLRISLVWRSRCFKTEHQRDYWRSVTSPEHLDKAIPLEYILRTFKEDLAARGKLPQNTPVKPLDLAMLILDVYTEMPIANSWMPYNYCMAKSMLPKLAQSLFALIGC